MVPNHEVSMKRRTAIVAIALGVALMALHGCGADRQPAGMLPDEVNGWTPDGEDGRYDADTLYDYIDGGAEVYRALGVVSVVGRRYAKEGAPEIIADVFDMGSSEGAYGAYHHDPREGGTAGPGTESEYIAGALAFWKGRYFVSVLAMDDTEDVKEAVLSIGRHVADAIVGEGAAPEIVAVLPEAGLLEDHVRYFRGPMLLDRYYSLGDGNPLGLDDSSEGILARYRISIDEGEDVDYVVLVVRFATPDRADLGLAALGRMRPPESIEEGAVTRGPFLVAVFGVPDRETAQAVLEEVSARTTNLESP
jgi:hypothetical protein